MTGGQPLAWSDCVPSGLCVCACVCVYVSACMCLRGQICPYHMVVFHACACAWVCTCDSACGFLSLFVCYSVHVCVFLNVCVCVCVCVSGRLLMRGMCACVNMYDRQSPPLPSWLAGWLEGQLTARHPDPRSLSLSSTHPATQHPSPPAQRLSVWACLRGGDKPQSVRSHKGPIHG